MAPYVDGGIAGSERAQVAEHLEACPPCRVSAEEQAAAHQVLRARAGSLVRRAPLSLQARCAGAARRGRPGVRPRLILAPFAAAAAVLLAVAASLYVTRGTAASLATQLAVDHVKCFAFADEPSAPVDPVALSRALRASYGFTVRVPDSAGEHSLRLIGARRCVTADGRVAHILYRHDGHDLSLFVIPNRERPARAVSVIGHRAVIWSGGGNSYVVVGREPEPQLRRAAYYLQREVR